MKIRYLFALLAALSISSTAFGAGATYQNKFIGKGDYQSMNWGEGKVTTGWINGIAEVTASTSKTILAGVKTTARCAVMSQRGTIEAYCSATDGDGDVQHTLNKRSAGDMKSGRGTIQLMGGTGKYDRLTGNCTYSVTYYTDNWVETDSNCEVN